MTTRKIKFAIVAVSALAAACGGPQQPADDPGDGPAEEAGEQMDDAAEDVQDKAEDVGDKTEDAVDEAEDEADKAD